MVSALAAQLARQTTLNPSQLAPKARKKNPDSYLFTPQDAGHHDMDAVYALGLNGFTRLTSLEPALDLFEEQFFSDSARELNRTNLNVDEIHKLDKALGFLLRKLSAYLLESPASKVLEWLVRRFRINEFNLDDVIAAFLPYHETTQFSKMLSILHIKESSMWSFLLPFKLAAKPLQRTSLVLEMTRNQSLARSVVSIIPEAVEDRCVHRSLVAFNAGVAIEYISRLPELNEETVAFILPALTSPLKTLSGAGKDCILGSYVALAALSQKCKLAPAAIDVILRAVGAVHDGVTIDHALPVLVSVCGSQEEIPQIHTSILKVFGKVPHIEGHVMQVLGWRGVDNFLCPLIAALTRRLDIPWQNTVIASLISNGSRLSPRVLRRIADLLFGLFVEQSPDARQLARVHLSTIHQRHPSIFSEASQAFLESLEDEGVRGRMEELLISMTLGVSAEGEQMGMSNMLVAAGSSDSNTRMIAVRRIVQAFSDGPPEQVSQPMRDVVLARLADQDPLMIAEIYTNPEALLSNIGGSSLLPTVISSIKTPSVPRSVLRSHFAFLGRDFSARHSESVLTVFEEAFYPYLLVTKPRQKTSALAWGVVGDSHLGQLEILNGCVEAIAKFDLFSGTDEKDKEREASKMAGANVAMAEKLADNIIVSTEFEHHLNYQLERLADHDAKTDSHARLLGHLVLRALILRLSGEQQVDVATRILEGLKLDTLDGLPDPETFAGDAINQAIALKPNSTATVQKLKADLLTLLVTIPRPSGVALDWVQHDQSSTVPSSERAGARYVRLLRRLYSLANSTSTLDTLSARLVQKLFTNLGNDTLSFLAGVWAAPIETESSARFDTNVGVQLSALRHAEAFMRAQNGEQDGRQDFQVIIPSLLIALHSEDRYVRDAALSVFGTMSEGSEGTQRASIYAFESLYGGTSDCVQYVDWPDVRRYTQAVIEQSANLAADSQYMSIFQQDHLRKKKGDNKKNSSYKQGILCYLFSHIVAWRSLSARLILLQFLRHVPHAVKLSTCLPLIQDIVDNGGQEILLGPPNISRLLGSLLLEAFDGTVAPLLNDANGVESKLFTKAMSQLESPLCANFVRSAMLAQAEIVFPYLGQSRKVDLCSLMLQIASRTTVPAHYSELKACLKHLLTDATVMVLLIGSIQAETSDPVDRAKKRAKLSSELSGVEADSSLQALICLGETLSSISLPGSSDLMESLLETLGKVRGGWMIAKADLDYVEQLLMSALESCVVNAQAAGFALSAVRIDVLVALVRSTNNPQTFHQALLLIASMARLSPDAVLHNVMPIFTFMGSNVFHRDDTFSFKVVQQTVDNIVPIMAASLRKTHSTGFDLTIASRDFLRIFTEASTHVPRHRRNKFFTHLIQVLGPDDFMLPLCLLLVDKVASRLSRQEIDQAVPTLALPLHVLERYPPSGRAKVLIGFMEEAGRLLSHVRNPESTEVLFLEIPAGAHTALPSAVIKRQVLALVIFVGVAWSRFIDHPDYATEIRESDQDVQRLVALMLETVLSKGAADDVGLGDVKAVARRSLHLGIGATPATQFAASILTMTQSSDATIKTAAFELLVSRLCSLTAEGRATVSPTILELIREISGTLNSHAESSATAGALLALKSIAMSALSSEESELAQALPAVVKVGSQGTEPVGVLAVLEVLATRLGPRLIPHLKTIIDFCLAALSGSREEAHATLRVVSALVNAIPSFWGPELAATIAKGMTLATDADLNVASAVTELFNTIASKIPSRTLLPAIVSLWDGCSSASSKDRCDETRLLFGLLKQALGNTARADVLEHLRSLFRVFLEAFDLRGRLDSGYVEVEQSCIEAFTELASKLNETTFKPLLRRLHDWAFTESKSEGNVARWTTFCHAVIGLFDQFQGLMSPFFGMLLAPTAQILEFFAGRPNAAHVQLWTATLDMVQRCFTLDEEGFWREDRLESIMPALLKQIQVAHKITSGNANAPLVSCIKAMAGIITREETLRQLNMRVFMYTRSEELPIRLTALACAQSLWEEGGEQLAGFAPETLVFIEECAEDENDDVARAARKLKRTLDAATGNDN